MFDTKNTNRLGNDGMVWFYGVVEDIDDPLQLGRLRVRILGDHTQSKKLIPTEDLPWAYLINNSLSSSIQGIGDSPTGLYVLGSWVFGFYGDGIDKQQPIIQGSFGGIPESIAWKPKRADEENVSEELESADVGFQDPNMEFPLPPMIFEQDTNRLARNIKGDHAFEIPEDLVPPQEIMIEDGLCPKKPVFGKKYYDKFDEAFVRKFAQGESSKHECDDTVIGTSNCGTKDLKVEDKEDEKCQFFLTKNDHPFTVYKFINRERFIPKAKVFADPMHREYWHEPDNPWGTKYPYNKVWEGYHKKDVTTIENPKNKFVSEAFGYNQTITEYDGSKKEGIYRKQKCGVGTWGLGEEWDSTEGSQRYHRFHPKGNYFEIDNDGNETRKIYGDQWEIDLKDKTILIKGDWNITVEGNKNQLIEGDYNLQVMGDKNTDVRGDIKTHADGKNEWHFKENSRLRVDGDERVRIGGSRDVSVCINDYIESQTAERRADEIVRKGGKSMIDEAFVKYELKSHEAEISICTLDSQIKTWNNVNETKTDDIQTLTEKITTHTKDVGVFNHTISTYSKNISSLDETIGVHTENVMSYDGCIGQWQVETESFIVFYQDVLLFEQILVWECGIGMEPSTPSIPDVVDVGQANYPETDGISQCLKRYNECIEAAKGACMTTLKDPRTLEDYTRFDWEKYHASLESCRLAYVACCDANVGAECDVCSPVPGVLVWDCTCHDGDCPAADKEYEFYNCDCECHGPVEPVLVDPWLECDQEKP